MKVTQVFYSYFQNGLHTQWFVIVVRANLEKLRETQIKKLIEGNILPAKGKMFAPTLIKFICGNPNAQWDGIRGWGLR